MQPTPLQLQRIDHRQEVLHRNLHAASGLATEGRRAMSDRNGASESLRAFLGCCLHRSKDLLVDAVYDEEELQTFITPPTLSYELDVLVLTLGQEGKFPLHRVDAALHTAPDPSVHRTEYRVSNALN